ncbi:signal peptidase I [Pseudoflavonifractor phocaeensis]|uniref:signal peptidase I n=1 Tax=Pseudoflavonifractor phocaeensis TaxID=1870988 RepID=UPI001F221D0C|nr:signal peptidase I [Pseudoflavonifractor phocaeensis]MCF2596770.1 signal peptidase I [Pseudoflavonifractor phocaeensis]MDY3905358.1 signal peptidase I [Lawsonibacter sp.]
MGRKQEGDKYLQYPTLDQMEEEISRLKYRKRYGRALRGTVYSLAVVAAVAILVATLWMPVLQITGASMAPTLVDGQFVVAVKKSEFQTGDITAFYYNNKILIKRVIASAGDWVDISENGDVYVNGVLLEEPYIKEKSLGECNIEFPYQVPDGKVFVMGDDRAVSLDSRTTAVGPVSKEQVLGRVVFRVWPLSAFGRVE